MLFIYCFSALITFSILLVLSVYTLLTKVETTKLIAYTTNAIINANCTAGAYVYFPGEGSEYIMSSLVCSNSSFCERCDYASVTKVEYNCIEQYYGFRRCAFDYDFNESRETIAMVWTFCLSIVYVLLLVCTVFQGWDYLKRCARRCDYASI